MPNGNVHRLVVALTVGSACAQADARQRQAVPHPLVGAALAAGFTNVPDLLEPACHPHHRQFFHSVAVASLLVWAGYRLYHWKPETATDATLRHVLLVGAGAYVIHLALDTLTAKSLPLFGKL